MSNYWYYDILFRQTYSFDVAVDSAFSAAGTYGYTPVNPVYKHLVVNKLGLNDLEELAFATSEGAIKYLGANGGLIDFWKNDDTITLIFTPDKTAHDNATQRAFGREITHGRCTFSEISLSVNDYRLKFDKDPEQSVQVATDVQGMFLDICEAVDAVYGYSCEEMLFEFFADELGVPIGSISDEIEQAACSMKAPAFLYWLQYFSPEYAAQATLFRMVKFGATFHKLSKGVAVLFFTWPWQHMHSNRMFNLNRRWR